MKLYNELKGFRGALTEVAHRTGYSYTFVKRSLKGDVVNMNYKIQLEASKVLAQRKNLDSLLGELAQIEAKIIEAA